MTFSDSTKALFLQRFPKSQKVSFWQTRKLENNRSHRCKWEKPWNPWSTAESCMSDFLGRPAPPPPPIEGPVDQQYQQCHQLSSTGILEYLSLKENYGKLIGTTFWNKQNHSSETFRKHCNIITQPKGPWNESLNSNFPTMSEKLHLQNSRRSRQIGEP